MCAVAQWRSGSPSARLDTAERPARNDRKQCVANNARITITMAAQVVNNKDTNVYYAKTSVIVPQTCTIHVKSARKGRPARCFSNFHATRSLPKPESHRLTCKSMHSFTNSSCCPQCDHRTPENCTQTHGAEVAHGIRHVRVAHQRGQVRWQLTRVHACRFAALVHAAAALRAKAKHAESCHTRRSPQLGAERFAVGHHTIPVSVENGPPRCCSHRAVHALQ